MNDVAEVSSYVNALLYRLGRIQDGFPLSNRLIRETHGKLLAAGRGAEKILASSAGARTSLGARAPEMRCSCLRQRRTSRSA